MKTELESKKISDDCFLKTYITHDEKTYILEINYKSGRFVSEKQFTNDFNGVAYMEEFKSCYRDENDVKKYFGII